MSKSLKIVVSTAALILLLALMFFFWGSSGWVADEYNKVDAFGEEKRPKDTLMVMTYNLGYLSGMTNNLPLPRPQELFDSNLRRATSLLAEQKPDILGFQEIDFDSNRSNNVDQMDEIGIALDYYQGFSSINWDKRYVPFPYFPLDLHFGKMKSGQAIMSQYSMDNIASIVLQSPSEAPFYYSAFYLDRLVQIADLQIGETTVKVMNVHLEAFYPETRANQVKVVKGLFEKFSEEMPVLLIGDFNGEAPWVDETDEAMKDLFETNFLASAIGQEQYLSNIDGSHTFSSGDPQKMIDFIFYNTNYIERMDANVLSDAGDISDHLPVAMRFVFKSEIEVENSE